MLPTTQLHQETIKALANLVDLHEQGTLFTACIHEMGGEYGPAGKKLVYGDNIKQVLIWTGFSYRALISRSMKALTHQLGKGGYIESLAQATLEVHEDTTIEDVCHALQETRTGYRSVLAKSTEEDTDEGPGPGPGPGIWEPLEIGGIKVRGCFIYAGKARPEDPRAPIPGTVYVRGLKLGEKMVTPAPNGQWKADSKPKTLAKQIIKEGLPVGLYRSYRLEPSRVSGIAVAKAAVEVAREQKILIDPEILTKLFKVA